MSHCIVHNAKGDGIIANNSYIGLSYCQLTNTLGNCLTIFGGKAEVDHCTLAQFYPFNTTARGVALVLASSNGYEVYPTLRIDCKNSIVTGYADDQVMVYLADSATINYTFADCLLRTPAVEGDTVNFKRIQWETSSDSIQGKQHFAVVDERNLIYDFHLDSLSTAKGKGCY